MSETKKDKIWEGPKFNEKTDRGCGNHCLSNQPFIVAVVGWAAEFSQGWEVIQDLLANLLMKKKTYDFKPGKIPYDRLCSISLLLYLQIFHPSIMLKHLHHAETFPSCWNISIMLYHHDIAPCCTFPSRCNIPIKRLYQLYVPDPVEDLHRVCTKCTRLGYDLHRGCTRIVGRHQHGSLLQGRPGCLCPQGSLHLRPKHCVSIAWRTLCGDFKHP